MNPWLGLVQFVNNRPRVSATPHTYDIAEGVIPSHCVWSKLGYNSDIQTTEEILSPQGGTYVFPAAEMQLWAVQSSTADRNTGTGIGSITVWYLDDDYTEKSTDVTLNAASVALSVADVFRINNIRAKTVGTNGKAVGTINIQGSTVGGTLTYGHIAIGNTRQRQLVYTVPAGKTLYMTRANVYNVHTAANKRAIITMRATYDDKLGARLTAGTFFMPYAEAVLTDNPVMATYDPPKKFVEKVDIIVVGISTGTASSSIALSGWIETN
jgi:hypothetical protein